MTETYKVAFTRDTKRYTLDLTVNGAQKLARQKDTAAWFGAFFQKFFAENPTLSPFDLERVNGEGVHLKGKRVFSHPDLFLLQSKPEAQATKKTTYLWKAFSLGEVPSPASLKPLSSAQMSHEVPGVAKAEFKFLDPELHPHLLDQIPVQPRWNKAESLTKAELAQLETAYLAQESGKTVKDDDPSLSETRIGTLLGTEERHNYRMTLQLERPLKVFFGKPELQSDIIFGKNSPLNGVKTKEGTIKGAVTSSFNRFADTISMLRKIEASNQSSHAYAGHVDTDDKAEEIAQFVFFGEIEKFEDGSGFSKGIRLRDDGKYELTFAVQSLLNMLGSDYDLFKSERGAYQRLAGKTLQLRHPETGKVYEVIVQPIPLIANQFWTNYFESIFLRFAKPRAEEQTNEADRILFQLAKEKRLELQRDGKFDKLDLLNDTLAILKEKKSSKPFEQITQRALLIHLLDLPEVFNCKSNVYRAQEGFAIPLAFTIGEWLESGRKVPLVDGRRNIAAIFNHALYLENGEAIYPAREIFFFKMLHELKMSEFSRVEKGLKIFDGTVTHPALRELLPKRFLNPGMIHFFDSFQEPANTDSRTYLS